MPGSPTEIHQRNLEVAGPEYLILLCTARLLFWHFSVSRFCCVERDHLTSLLPNRGADSLLTVCFRSGFECADFCSTRSLRFFWFSHFVWASSHHETVDETQPLLVLIIQTCIWLTWSLMVGGSFSPASIICCSCAFYFFFSSSQMWCCLTPACILLLAASAWHFVQWCHTLPLLRIHLLVCPYYQLLLQTKGYYCYLCRRHLYRVDDVEV
jgi:hypothetical protein